MRKRSPFIIVLILSFEVLSIEEASGRVFKFKEQSFSTYLRGTYGFSNLQKNAYQPGFPSTVEFPDSNGVNQEYSGEIGFGLSMGGSTTFRLGVELLSSQGTTALAGVTASGTKLLNADSQVYSIIPEANVEIFVKKSENWRIYVGGGAGYAVTTLKNSYTMTALGNTTLGVSDYLEEGTGWGIMGQALSGIEWAFFDTVSCSLDLGYRYLIVSNYTSNRNSNTAYGQIATGNPIKNFDGTNRKTDLSGFWSGIALRIYIQ